MNNELNTGGAAFPECVYCPNCDYAIIKEQYDAMYEEGLISGVCPRCKIGTLPMFYHVGSVKHRERREAWLRGEIIANPPSLTDAMLKAREERT